MADTPASGSSTPNPRFASSGDTAEDLLKEQTVGLVHLSDFRKRRAEALEQSRDGTPTGSGATTPTGRAPAAKAAIGFKKRKKGVKKGGLSFGEEDEEDVEGNNGGANVVGTSTTASRDNTPADEDNSTTIKKRLKPNNTISFQPKIQTKSALLREAQLKDALRKEYQHMQEAVRQTEFCLPFVFFDGRNAPGGTCRMKKGDFIWLFLEKARKVGAGIASTGGGAGRPGGGGSMKDWARIGVDDLMVVRGELIIPHHLDFHHFIVNHSTGYNNTPLFRYSAEPTAATPEDLLPSQANSKASEEGEIPSSTDRPSYLTFAADRKESSISTIPDADLEGYGDDPALTKVVDRRWYEKNKHIYPASTWEDFDPEKDYAKGIKKDVQGNSFFYSR